MNKTITLILLEIWNRIQVALVCILLLIAGIASPKWFLQAIDEMADRIKTKE